MTYIKTRKGNKLYIKDWGEGRPVILIHGWPLCADTWDEVSVSLAEAGYRAISYDRLGFGRSSQPYEGYDYDSLSDDLADVIRETSAKDATIVGFSMGGGEVARYMSRHEGKNVVKTVLVSTVLPGLLKTPDNPDGVDAAVFNGMGAALRADRATFFGGFFKDFYGPKVGNEILEWTRKMAMEASVKAMLDCAHAFSFTDFRGDLPAFKVPTLIIHGTGDNNVPIDLSSRKTHKAIPGSKLIEYEGSPHGVFVTDREKLTNDILNWVRN